MEFTIKGLFETTKDVDVLASKLTALEI